MQKKGWREEDKTKQRDRSLKKSVRLVCKCLVYISSTLPRRDVIPGVSGTRVGRRVDFVDVTLVTGTSYQATVMQIIKVDGKMFM